MIIKHYIIIQNLISIILLILKLFHGWESIMLEVNYMKKLLISSKELLKFNLKKLNGDSWLQVAIEELDLPKKLSVYMKKSMLNILIISNVFEIFKINFSTKNLGLRFLVQLCKELGLPFEEYAGQLRQLERQMEALEARYPFQQGGGV